MVHARIIHHEPLHERHSRPLGRCCGQSINPITPTDATRRSTPPVRGPKSATLSAEKRSSISAPSAILGSAACCGCRQSEYQPLYLIGHQCDLVAPNTDGVDRSTAGGSLNAFHSDVKNRWVVGRQRGKKGEPSDGRLCPATPRLRPPPTWPLSVKLCGGHTWPNVCFQIFRDATTSSKFDRKRPQPAL